MDEFEEHANRAFEEEMITHLNDFAPELCRILGPEGLRVYVRSGLERARTYDFTNRGPARFYLELMFSFGSGFDSDPQLSWARAALHSSERDQMARAGQLHELMEEYLHDVAGPDNEYAMQALRRLKDRRIDVTLPQADAGRVLKQQLREAYPEKYAYVGDEVIAILIRSGVDFARDHNLPVRGVGVLTGMMFGFGFGVLEDPLYGWVRRTLDDPLVGSGEDKIDRLAAKLRVYVDAMLSRPAPASHA
jgi:hypothetical protein